MNFKPKQIQKRTKLQTLTPPLMQCSKFVRKTQGDQAINCLWDPILTSVASEPVLVSK